MKGRKKHQKKYMQKGQKTNTKKGKKYKGQKTNTRKKTHITGRVENKYQEKKGEHIYKGQNTKTGKTI